MTTSLRCAVPVALALLAAPVAQAEQSPIFGTAAVTPMSSADARAVTARGYYADYFGSIGIDYAYSSYLYGLYARYYSYPNSYSEQYWYSSAQNYASTASSYFYYAYYYSAIGY